MQRFGHGKFGWVLCPISRKVAESHEVGGSSQEGGEISAGWRKVRRVEEISRRAALTCSWVGRPLEGVRLSGPEI